MTNESYAMHHGPSVGAESGNTPPYASRPSSTAEPWPGDCALPLNPLLMLLQITLPLALRRADAIPPLLTFNGQRKLCVYRGREGCAARPGADALVFDPVCTMHMQTVIVRST